MSIAVSVRDVSIKYRTIERSSKSGGFFTFKNTTSMFEAVKGVSFDVEKGKILGIIGRNGSGKSTLLRAIAGIYSPDRGSINLYNNSTSLLALGVGFEKKLTGRDNIILSGMLMGFSEEQVLSKIDEIINFADIGMFIDKPVSTYSSGMHSKLAFSITATLETDIMLVDEVLSVGDASFKKKSYEKMLSLINKDDRTVIIVSHNLDTIRKLCEKTLWLDDGLIKVYDYTDNVLDLYQKNTK